jgi:hypothetical protein
LVDEPTARIAMKTLALFLAACPAAAVFSLARAAGGDPAISESAAASAASAAAPSTVRRQLSFRAKHMVPTQFTLADPNHAPVGTGFRFQTRFAGQAQVRDCVLELPKAGQQVKAGETAVGTIQCSEPWAVYDNGLSYDAMEKGAKIGGGLLRP